MPAKTIDFNGDGKSDILWQNTNGDTTIWQMDGTSITYGPIYDVDPRWHAIDTGDFNGDGKSDILWQNTNGDTTIWQMDGTSITYGPVYDVDPRWHAITTGDFNGDGKSDILWQNTNGDTTIWQMDGTSITYGPIYDVDPRWHAITTGDFNGDGKSDILWQNTNGDTTIWQMDGTSITYGPIYDVDPRWHAIDTGDFNGDGKSDILWQNTNGDTTIWQMNGTSITYGPIYDVDPRWHAIDTGDFNGDGKSDILWQNTNGDTTIWQMNGTSITYGPIYDVDPRWHAIDTGGISKKIALTFDDGPDPTFTPQILQVLQSFGVKATFFEVGEMVLLYPDQTRAVVSAGDLVENHSFNHPDLITLSDAQIRDQLQQTSDAIFNITDTRPQYFRPPYGSVDSRVESIIEAADMKTTLWTVDTNDWQMGGVDGIVQAALNGASDGGIILMHDGGGDRSQTVDALDDIIVGLQGQGYEFVTIDQILNLPPWDLFV